MMTRLLRRKSIEKKLFLLVTLACAAGLIVASVAFLVGKWIDIRDQARREARMKLEFVASFLSAAIESGDNTTATNILAALKSNSQTAGLSGYVTEGGLIGSLAGSTVPTGAIQGLDRELHFDGGTVYLYRPVMVAGKQRMGVICLQAQIRPAYWKLVLSGLGVLGVFAFSIAVAVWVSSEVRRTISEPIKALWQTSRLVSAGDGSGGPGAAADGEDELARLAEGFGEVVAKIQSREAALVKSQSELEKRVAERTRELQEEIQQRSKVEAALADEKERLAVTLRSIADGVVATDCRGDIVLFNIVAEELTGWPSKEAVGRNLRQVLRCYNAETRQPVANLVEDALRTGASTKLSEGVLLVGRDQTERLIELSCSPILDAGGKSIGVVVVFRDVTEQQRHVEALLTASKLQSIGMMAGGIAHDFNNILTSVLGHISMAKRSPTANGELIEHLACAEESALKAREITRQLQTFAKSGLPVKRTVRVNDLITEATGFALRGSNVRSRITIDDALWPVDVDESQFSQVIQNVVLRGVRAMAGGGTIEVRAANVTIGETSVMPLTSGNYILISIHDHGQPIKPEDIPNVFDPYFVREGGGLGLAAAYTIVKRHGGHIAVDPKPDKGTAFHIYLPAKVGPTGTQTREQSSSAVKRILLMDDDEQIRRVASAMLESVGYEVTTVEDGETAIERFVEARSAGRPFDVVILDLTVQGSKGGKETIQELLLIDSKVRAIVSSGYCDDPVMARYREYGFAAAVPKPYNFDELESVLRKLLYEPEPARVDSLRQQSSH
jgi:PAS domain S-box-containing protein